MRVLAVARRSRDRYQAYARLLISGQPSRPFSMRTLSPERRKLDPRREEIIRRYSRQRYSQSAARVEQAIRRTIAGTPA
jgi:hypothetical protein